MLQEILAAFDISLNQTSENYQQCVATGFSAEKLPPVKEAESKPITNESTSIKASKGSNVQLANGYDKHENRDCGGCLIFCQV